MLSRNGMRRYFALFKQTVSEFSADKVPRLGAALAYYTIFSIAPLLLIAIAIAGIVFGREAASGAVYAQLRGVLGPASAEVVGGDADGGDGHPHQGLRARPEIREVGGVGDHHDEAAAHGAVSPRSSASSRCSSARRASSAS